ncbi:polyphenol oxidase family protein [Candidatus Woesebacteria bacterium]|nr:polyphenol oxidase family protein [Candidatus Woesebacteria bacterium]
MYKISSLDNLKELFHAFSTVKDGNMSLVVNQEKVDAGDVINNRKKFFKKIGIDFNRVMTVWLQHGNNIVEAKEKWLGKTVLGEIDPPKADAVITDQKNTFLALTIADCVPVIIYDPKKHAVGLVHAGWKGVDKKIVVKTIYKMSRSYGTRPEDLIIGIGPCIGKDNYLKDNFSEGRKKIWGGFVEDRGKGIYSVDLAGYIYSQLIRSRINEENIYFSEIDVFEDERFYSHYRDVRSKEGDKGRNFCVVGLQK